MTDAHHPGTGAADPTDGPDPRRPSSANEAWTVTSMQVAGLASLGAGAVHAAAAGVHAEHATLARLFVLGGAAQIAIGIVALVRGGRVSAALAAVVNGAAVAFWAVTRIWGISWIAGLEAAEPPQFADTACAALGALAAAAALVSVLSRRTEVDRLRLGVPAVGLGAVTVVAMIYAGSFVHSHGGDDHGHAVGSASGLEGGGADHAHGDDAAADDHHHDTGAPPATTGETSTPTTAHGHDAGDEHAHGPAARAETAAGWPRPWDPRQPIDFSGVAGVTPEQQQRAEDLVARTLRDLPQFADVGALPALGYRSIGDEGTGFEHWINYGYIADEAFLDPTKPESLVYAVSGGSKTLVSAMFIANAMPLDDPELVGYGGELMQWHNHQNLCWIGTEEGPKVIGVTDAAGNCPNGSVNAGGENPMVHVWIAPHECGPFAALEGHGAGQTDPATGERTDLCAHEHGAEATGSDGAGPHADSPAGEETAAPVPYDPAMPIDLSGTPGVTPQQQAYAENLVARTVVDLPQWSDPAVAEAAGFRSIGDGGTGHEHYIQWDWINDDVWLDPDAPESLVFEPQPDGTKQLVSAMYMLPDTMTLDEVPNGGGALMQWHIHDNLCFTDDPEAPQVGGITNRDGTCNAPLVKLGQSPMIHVWIEPHPCGPFAALEGIAAGAILPGEERLCDTAHGGH